ncbi:hypothetical protein AUTU_19540 [Aureibacter tunicatorum]|nr:hypothetical protein AUTU_19540 [Aureibacter tunicatorum]
MLFVILISNIFLGIKLLIDAWHLFVSGKFYEGYVFAMYIMLFDIIVFIPLIVVLLLRGVSKMKKWAILSVVSQNIVMFVGFKLGSILGVLFCLTSLIYYFKNCKKIA